MQQDNPFGQPGGPNPFGPPGIGGGPFGGNMDAMMAEMIKTRYTPWFWVWLVLIAGALGPLVGEAIAAGNRRPRWRPSTLRDY
jgi:hypothetical protein